MYGTWPPPPFNFFKHGGFETARAVDGGEVLVSVHRLTPSPLPPYVVAALLRPSLRSFGRRCTPYQKDAFRVLSPYRCLLIRSCPHPQHSVAAYSRVRPGMSPSWNPTTLPLLVDPKLPPPAALRRSLFSLMLKNHVRPGMSPSWNPTLSVCPSSSHTAVAAYAASAYVTTLIEANLAPSPLQLFQTRSTCGTRKVERASGHLWVAPSPSQSKPSFPV